MGRNGRRPDDYKPLLELYLRAKPEGGKLLVPGELRGLPDAVARRECLVLVHGFNSTDTEAAEAYSGFRTRQKEIFSPRDPADYDRRFGDTFWPGDADLWPVLDRIDFLIYPAAVHTAVSAAKDLAEVLWKMPNLQRVDFIGHSLGCRVTLETLLLLRTRTLPMIGRVMLMAAAVPSEMLEGGGKFHELLRQLATEGTDIRILHSQQDPVLHYAFPPGQSLAGGKEASNRALGRFGPTPWMPGFRSTLTEREIAGAAHGDYWGPSGTPPSRLATEDAGTFLKLGEIGRDVGEARAVGVSRISQPSRNLGLVTSSRLRSRSAT
jgi:pimeloyl-ACP methyl ester carboxylesterase